MPILYLLIIYFIRLIVNLSIIANFKTFNYEFTFFISNSNSLKTHFVKSSFTEPAFQ